MCGRFTLTASPEEVARSFGLEEPPALAARYNAAPGQEIATVRVTGDEGRRVWAACRWGLVPFWAESPTVGGRLVNARAETVAEKPAFRHALVSRRCLIPADGFYEWAREAGARRPMHVARRDGAVFGFAGLWERWKDPGGGVLESCTVLTTAADERLRALHDRMPVILDPSHYGAWLDPALRDPERLLPLLVSAPGMSLRVQPVSRRVNDVANDDPACLTPADEVPEPTQLGLL